MPSGRQARDLSRRLLNTQLCYSNARARRAVVDYAVRYVQENGHIDVLHVWLADKSNKHCECPNCRDTLAGAVCPPRPLCAALCADQQDLQQAL
jgi:hypothetical protein